MIDDVWTFFIHGIWSELDPELKLFHTAFVPTVDVTATIALSLVTFGAKQVGDHREMGWVGGVIKKGAFADAQNHAQNIPVATTWDRNGLRINRCVFVTYQLSVAFGEAIAQCNLFFHGAQGVRASSGGAASTRHAIVFDKKSGQALTVHSVTALPGARVPSDRLLLREIRKCAAEDLKRAERSVAVHLHEKGDILFSEGLRVEARAGRLLVRPGSKVPRAV